MPVETRDDLNATPVENESNVIDSEGGGAGKTFIFPSATPFNAELIKSLMYIEFSGRTIESIGSFVRLENVIKTGQEIGKWRFIAPNEILESTTHDYEDFESIGQRLGQLDVTARGIYNDGEVLFEASKDAYSKATSLDSNNSFLRAAEQTTMAAGAGANDVGKPKNKVDSILAYKDSKRKEYNFEFEFAWYQNDDPQEKIFKPIRMLTEYSCASMASGTLTQIDWPSVFSIKSVLGDGSPTGLINIRNAVITAIQPTWVFPYIKGYPSHCRLSISVTDIEPLYRRSWQYEI